MCAAGVVVTPDVIWVAPADPGRAAQAPAGEGQGGHGGSRERRREEERGREWEERKEGEETQRGIVEGKRRDEEVMRKDVPWQEGGRGRGFRRGN